MVVEEKRGYLWRRRADAALNSMDTWGLAGLTVVVEVPVASVPAAISATP